MLKKTGIILLFLISGIFCIFIQNTEAKIISHKKSSILFVGYNFVGYGMSDYLMARELYKEGFRINNLTGPLIWNEVKKYNVIVLTGTGLGPSNADFKLTSENKQNIAILNKFLSKGGGILYIPYWGERNDQIPSQQAFGKNIGLKPLFRDVIFDLKTQKLATAWDIPFAWTDNIKISPITKQVKGLWYPCATRVGGILHTVTFVPDRAWNVVIKGLGSSYTKRVSLLLLSDFEKGEKGYYSTDVPLLAYRKYGKGRIVCFSISSDYLFSKVAETTLEGIVLNKGLEGKPSYGYQILENSLKWLSASSRKENILGGAKMDKTLMKNPYRVQFTTPYNWNKGVSEIFPSPQHWYKGIIGAQAKYINGKWNIKDWVQAGKQAGLSYIVFLEPFTSLTKNKFAQLKQECKKYTTNNFTAIPGFTIKDEIGNHYFYCGQNTLYPSKKFLSSDGKEFVSYDPQVGGNPFQRGQLAMTTLDYTYTYGGFHLTAGNYLFSKNPIPFDNFYSDWDAMGVITTKNNHLIENSFPGYLQVVDFGQDPLPMAIDLINKPLELLKSQWYTMINPPAGISNYFSTWHFWPTASNIYITNGPKIEFFTYAGSRDYPNTTKTNYIWQNYRWLCQGEVSSKAGLKEVDVYNGTELFRRFLVVGKKQFRFSLDLTIDKQHYLVLVVTDINGKQAISRDHIDRNQKLELWQFPDRNNQLTSGLLFRKDGTLIHIPGNGDAAVPNKRIDPKEVNPAGAFVNDPRLGAPAFDGSAGGDPDFFSPVICNSVKGQILSPAVSDSLALLANGDVQIGEGIWKWNFSDNINVYNVWNTLWRTQPATEFTVEKTNYFFNIDPNSPISVYLWDIHIKLLKDIPNNGFSIGFIEPRESTTWAIKSGDKFYSGTYNQGKQQNISEPFNKGDYVADLNSPLGGMALFPLTNGLQIMTTVPGKNYIYINLPKQNSPQKKGQTKNIKLLFIGIPRNTSLTRNFYPSVLNKVVKRFYQKFGLSLNGKTGYTVNTANGKIISQRYLLNINGGKNRCFSGSITGNLISTLPVIVSNLENRDSVYLYDRGLNKARPIGVYNGKAYAVITLHGTRNLFIGEPVICDAPDLFVQVTQTGENRWHIGINNPTDRVIKAHIRLDPYFEPFKGKTIKGEITINPGTSISKTI